MVKTARGRTVGQVKWLQRQLNDPYVAAARTQGYRSRAAFKLMEMDDRYKLIPKGGRIVDLGAAPGGWTQVAVERAGPKGTVVGLDISPMDAVPGAEILHLDFLAEDAPERLKAIMGGEADAVISDMAAPATGHRQTDHMKIMALCEAALAFAQEVLKPGGAFVCKVQRGGTEGQLLQAMKRDFRTVAHVKPPASRADSAEMYVVALGFRGRS
ncbi:MAG: RlmE family RNA methyltransferase [Alphaproteobacteria bacterium]|jgi:23S rRNA (uridine2552-2'-O)-methyltransferase